MWGGKKRLKVGLEQGVELFGVSADGGGAGDGEEGPVFGEGEGVARLEGAFGAEQFELLEAAFGVDLCVDTKVGVGGEGIEGEALEEEEVVDEMGGPVMP